MTRSFDVFFDLCKNRRLINNREAGDLRRRHAHYDVSVMEAVIKGKSSLCDSPRHGLACGGVAFCLGQG